MRSAAAPAEKGVLLSTPGKADGNGPAGAGRDRMGFADGAGLLRLIAVAQRRRETDSV